jgi:hypothetical protein
MNNLVTNRIDFLRRMFALDAEFNSKVGDYWSMVRPQSGQLSVTSDVDTYDDFDRNNPYAIGGKRSFVPTLGEIVWELPQALAAHVPFSARIYRVGDGRQIGYVRVPHYTYNKSAVDVFVEVIARFESTTVAMVLDQVNNPGGSMFHMYAILSTLTDRILALPKHELKLDEDDVDIASETVALAEAGEAVPSDERPSPELVAYSRFVLSEVEAGRGLNLKPKPVHLDDDITKLNIMEGYGPPTNPVHLGGVVEILPAKTHYTKKIVVLINELDFSASEFLAAILQDNKRAILFGERTAGAGRCARRITFPNQFGIDCMTYSWTLAWRTNGQPIENIGVHPDVRYSITAEDLRGDYVGYRRALLATIYEGE